MLIDIYFYTIYFILGTIIGSYANMLIYRYVYGESIWKEQRSFCPNCRNTLKWYHLVPVFSYLFLNGKCSFCKKGISSRYIYLELFSGVLFLFLMYNTPVTVDTIVFYFIILLFLIPIIYIDVMIHLIYDGYLKLLILLTAIALFINEYVYAFNLHIELPSFKTGVIGFFAVYFGMVLFNKIGGLIFYGDYRTDLFGMGDVKLIAWMFMILGTFGHLLLFFFLSCVIGLILFGIHQLIFHTYYVSKKGQKNISFSITDSSNKIHNLSVYLSETINPKLYNTYISKGVLPYHFFVENINKEENTIDFKNGKMNFSLLVDDEAMSKIEKDKKQSGFDFYCTLHFYFDKDGNIESYTYEGLADYELYLQSSMRKKTFGSQGVPFAPGLIMGFLIYILFSESIFNFVFDLLIQVG